MSLFKKTLSRRGLMLGTLALGACGFEPVYAPQNRPNIDALYGKVKLPDANSSESFAMRSQLVSYFGEPNAPIYSLEIAYKSTVKTLAIRQNGRVTRKRITAKGRYRAKNLQTGEVLFDTPFQKIASVSGNRDPFATDQNLEDSKARLARSVADDLALQFTAVIAQRG